MSGTASDVRSAAERLRSERRPFVAATVVRAERPTSAKAGDAALVLDDGSMVGFVGGECAEASVQAQALLALESGEPVLLRITPDAPEPTPPGRDDAPSLHGGAPDTAPETGVVGPAGVADPAGGGAVTVHNPCLSGGTLEIFLEPALPSPMVLVHGDAPIARAVQGLADWLGYDARPWPPGGDEPHAGPGGRGAEVPEDADAVIVASHGGEEHAVLTAALRAGVPYVALVASPRRGAAVLGALDVSEADKARISTPAGFDIGARTPEEVALSILAELIDRRPRVPRPPVAERPSDHAPAEHADHAGEQPGHPADVEAPAAAASADPGHEDHGDQMHQAARPGTRTGGRRGTPRATTAVDPVCGMTVAAVDATRHIDHEGVRYWFCGPGCEDAFRNDPGAFLPT